MVLHQNRLVKKKILKKIKNYLLIKFKKKTTSENK